MPPFKKRIGPQTVIYQTIRGKSMIKELEDVVGTPSDGDSLVWNDTLKRFTFASEGELTELALPLRVVTASAVLTQKNTVTVVKGSGNVELTLPAANINPLLGAVMWVKNAGLANVKVKPAGTDTIEEASEVTINSNGALTFFADPASGTWYVI
jgi:hypothetical protein